MLADGRINKKQTHKQTKNTHKQKSYNKVGLPKRMHKMTSQRKKKLLPTETVIVITYKLPVLLNKDLRNIIFLSKTLQIRGL